MPNNGNKAGGTGRRHIIALMDTRDTTESQRLPDNPIFAQWRILGIALLIFGGVLAVDLYHEHGRIELREREQLSNQARIVEENMGRQLNAINLALASIRNDLPYWRERKDGLELASRRLKAMDDAMPSVRTINIIDAKGMIVSSNREELIGRNFSQRDYFKTPLNKPDTQALYISTPFKTSLGVFVVNASRMIMGLDGRFDGIVTATLDPKEFSILLDSVRYAPDVWASLAHGDGKMFLMVPEREGVVGMDLAVPGSFFTRHRQSGQMSNAMTGIVHATGEERMMAVRTIQPSTLHMDKPLVIAVARDLPTIFAPWRHDVYAKGSLFGMLLLVSILGMFYYQRRQRAYERFSVERLKQQQESVERLELALAGGDLGLWDWHVPSGKVTFNERWCAMLGYCLAEIEPDVSSWQTLAHPDDWPVIHEALDPHLKGETAAYESEHRLRNKYGHWVWVLDRGKVVERDAAGAPLRVVGTHMDITERKRTADALRDSERFMRTLIDILPGMVGYWTTELRCGFANKEYLTWFGKRPEEMRGIRVQDLLGEELFRKNEPFIRSALRGEPQRYERTLIKPNGEVGYTWAHYIPDFDGDQVRGFFVLVSDITELKQAQLQLEQINQSLQQRTQEAEAATRLKSQFLANISHEIRTPMNAVFGLLHLLLSTELTPRQQDYAQKVKVASESLLGLLNDILDFSKVEAGKLDLEQIPFRLDQVMHNLAVILSPSVQHKDLELVFDIGPDIPPVLRGDAQRLQQVLLNLVGNAVKFTEHGEVVVRLRTVSITPQRVEIAFCVRDTGIGIAPDKLATVFEAFSQAEASTNRRFGGSGLGLAICQRLVQLMGGALSVDSEVGQGSEFRFIIGFARDLETLTLEDGEHQAPLLRALIVDDNDSAREALAAMSRSLGWQVEAAASGADALARLISPLPPHRDSLRSQAGEGGRGPGYPPLSPDPSPACGRGENAGGFDVVFVDWNMPGMDGWETIHHLRQLRQGDTAPALILMVTAQGRESLAEALAEFEAGQPSLLDGFLIKPATASMLFNAVAEATRGSSLPADQQPMAARPSARRLAGLRLLVVDDNLMNQQVAQELLSHEGAYVEVVSSGRQAVERLVLAHLSLDAVLMDIQMPDMDGYAATREIRQTLKLTALPIIAMTADTLPTDLQACRVAGMNDYLGKPIDVEILVATLLRLCGRGQEMSRTVPPDALGGMAQLPKVPDDFGLKEALARLGNDHALYARMARTFRTGQATVTKRLRWKLQQGERVNAQRELHTLKGVAATLGAQSLARFAAEAETRIKAGTDSAENDVLLSGLATHLSDALHVLERLAVAFEPAAVTASSRESSIDPTQAISHLTELERLLAENNMRALDVHAALCAKFGADLQLHLAALNDAMNCLDFATALERSRNLRKLLAP